MLEPYQTTTLNLPVSDGSSERREVETLVRQRAALCAAIALEPVPLLDLAIVLPLHLELVARIGQIYGFDLSKARAKEIVLEFGGAVALTYVTRTAARSVLKLIPVLGPVLNAPMVFTGTYTLGMLTERYFRARRSDLPELERKEIAVMAQEFAAQAKSVMKNVRFEDWQRVARELLRKK
jgi:uncharacterized protein (DUF697 family)